MSWEPSTTLPNPQRMTLVDRLHLEQAGIRTQDGAIEPTAGAKVARTAS